MKNNKNYEEKEKEIIKKLLNNYKDKNIKIIVNKIDLFNPEYIDKDKIQKNNYNFINIELLKMINESKEFSESILECFHFKNDNK